MTSVVSRKNYCDQGHLMKGDNIGWRKQGVYSYMFCKTCNRKKVKQSREANIEKSRRNEQVRNWRVRYKKEQRVYVEAWLNQ